MALTTRTITSDGATTLYTLDFDLGYIKQEYVFVHLEENHYTEQLSYTWISSTQIQLAEPVATGVNYIVRRVVPRNVAVNDFQNGAIIHESNLNDSYAQLLMIGEEINDGFTDVNGNLTLAGELDMQGSRITNVGEAVLPTDTPNLGQLEGYEQTSGQSAIEAQASADAAAASVIEVTAISSVFTDTYAGVGTTLPTGVQPDGIRFHYIGAIYPLGEYIYLPDFTDDITTTNWHLVSGIGAQGATGAQGVQGANGLQGIQGINGETGPQGNTGPEGTVGQQGGIGPDGATGATGPQGIQGVLGETGSPGATGPLGPTGGVGPQGLQGIKGDQGDQGIQGIQGNAGPTGQTGAQGVQGLQGADGASFTVDDVGLEAGRAAHDAELDGYSYLSTDHVNALGTGSLFVKLSNTSGDWSTAIPFGVGPTGDQGPQGIDGVQGPAGVVGPDGAQGTQGSTGIDGAVGTQGPQGNVGTQGPQGLTGPTGAVGATGVQGATGDTGPDGADGPQGTIGITGVQGEQGLLGPVGPQGEQGILGAAGPQGEQGGVGVQGPQGGIGPTGLTGLTGTQGVTGDTGPTGDQGPLGNQGIRGSRSYYISGQLTWDVTVANTAIPDTPLENDLVIQYNDATGFSETRRYDGTAPTTNDANWLVVEKMVNSIPVIVAGINSAFAITDTDSINFGVGAGATGQGYDCVAIGTGAGRTSQDFESVAVGDVAGEVTQGRRSVAVGKLAGQFEQGDESVAVGNGAGATSQGNEGVAVGRSAGLTNQGSGAVAIGSGAGSNNQGLLSIAIGKNAGQVNASTSGDYSISLLGYGIGDHSIVLGQSATSWGDEGIAIGRFAGLSSGAEGSPIANWVAIGVGANATAANQFVLGNSSVTSLRCNDTSISSLSDKRDKTAVIDCPIGLDYIDDLRPVEFTWDYREEHYREGVAPAKEGRKEIGFLAQDLKAVQETYDIHSLNSYQEYEASDSTGGIDIMEADSGKLLPVLVKAIQELSAKVKLLEAA